jgi:hypothetical protein
MREHQIVISLKPEQFNQLQKLARAAGARSVGAFLREQLVTSLGVEGDAAALGAVPNWQLIGGQVRRLHRELQLFIAESSSIPEEEEDLPFIVDEDSLTPEGEPEPPPTFVPSIKAPEIQDSAAVKNLVEPAKVPADAMEELAERAFAISPRLGALDPLQGLLEESLLNPLEENDEDVNDEDVNDEELDQDDDGQPEPEDEPPIAQPTATQSGTRRTQITSQPPASADEDPDAAAEDRKLNPQPPARRTSGDDENSDDLDDESEGLANTPPISGGPPPRKPRT